MYEIYVKKQLESTSIVSRRESFFFPFFFPNFSRMIVVATLSAEIWHKGCVEPRSDGELCIEGLRADTVLKVVNLQTATGERPAPVASDSNETPRRTAVFDARNEIFCALTILHTFPIMRSMGCRIDTTRENKLEIIQTSVASEVTLE